MVLFDHDIGILIQKKYNMDNIALNCSIDHVASFRVRFSVKRNETCESYGVCKYLTTLLHILLVLIVLVGN